MAEYINRAELVNAFTAGDMQKQIKARTGEDAYNTLLDLINGAPDAVVKCARCRWMVFTLEGRECVKWGKPILPYDFCSYGERNVR